MVGEALGNIPIASDEAMGTHPNASLYPSTTVAMARTGVKWFSINGTETTMGMYVNPGSEGFQSIVLDEYVDKTGLIALVNGVINTPRKLVCVTRPRRFGKSFAAESLVAYYSCGCDSHELFAGLEISRSPSYEHHLNAYNLVHLDMTAFREAKDVAAEVTRVLLNELRRIVPTAGEHDAGRLNELASTLSDVVDATGRRFVFVIDEWDAPLRERRSKASQENWVYFLRTLFKNANLTAKVVAAAYMTGILPILRYGTQSALSDFREFTMLRPGEFAPYVGFTEAEVEALSIRHNMEMTELRRWYDGYELPYTDVVTRERKTVRAYAPFSVRSACDNGEVGPYWTSTEAFDSLRMYIDMDFDGLQHAVLAALGGADVPLRTGKFGNDMYEVASSDDVLTLLCHLGYLAYSSDQSTCSVPNEEVRRELADAVAESHHTEVARIVRQSEELLEATVAMNEDTVAYILGKVHDSYATPLFYNGEQALRSVVKYAYLAAADHYARVEELPGGRGFADVAYLPRRGTGLPALLVELKWDKPVDSAMAQIHERNYPEPLRNLDVPILLVGVTYEPKTKEHRCVIEPVGGDKPIA